MKVESISELPSVYTCRTCGEEKPVVQMVVVRLRREKKVLLRSICKDCNNVRERGHRREWKRNYLRRWRKWNAELNETYWRQRNVDKRSELNARALVRFYRHHDAILIQGRLRRRLRMSVSLAEATQLCKKFGPCYPSRFGLTEFGLQECERIRSSMRRLGKKLHPVEIRMMVYEDGYYKKPSRQTIPYKLSAEKLRQWHKSKAMAA